MHNNIIPDAPGWKTSGYICALGDSERHYGHAVKLDGWHAWDATKMNDASDGFFYLGVFDEVEDAKRGVERAVAQRPGRRTLLAAAGASTLWGA